MCIFERSRYVKFKAGEIVLKHSTSSRWNVLNNQEFTNFKPLVRNLAEEAEK